MLLFHLNSKVSHLDLSIPCNKMHNKPDRSEKFQYDTKKYLLPLFPALVYIDYHYGLFIPKYLLMYLDYRYPGVVIRFATF